MESTPSLSPLPGGLITGLVLLIGGRGRISLVHVTHYSVMIELKIPYPLFCMEYNVYNWIVKHFIIKITISEGTGAVYGQITVCLYTFSSAILIIAQEVSLIEFSVERRTQRLHSERIDMLLKKNSLEMELSKFELSYPQKHTCFNTIQCYLLSLSPKVFAFLSC